MNVCARAGEGEGARQDKTRQDKTGRKCQDRARRGGKKDIEQGHAPRILFRWLGHAHKQSELLFVIIPFFRA